MAGTKISALTAGNVPIAADVFPSVQSSATVKVTASQIRQYVGEGLSNVSTATVSAGYATDTYLAGSAITIPTAGGWRVGTILKWQFDMTKTALGTAPSHIDLKMGTTGLIGGDPLIVSLAFAVGTAVADTGIYDVTVIFRSVGSGTTAVVQMMARCTHHLAATGLTTTGASGTAIILGTSAGFNSTTQTIAGLVFGGGASFSGTNTYVMADADNL